MTPGTAHRTQLRKKPACLCTTTAPDGAEDADFSARVLLRLCAAVPAKLTLPSSEGIQQVQSGTGELEDACFFFPFYLMQSRKQRVKNVALQKFGNLLTFWFRMSWLCLSCCIAEELSFYILKASAVLSYFILLLLQVTPPPPEHTHAQSLQ